MRIAAFTMAWNEAAFLPIWLAHYGAQFGRENLYVIDHGSTDGSTEGLWPTQRFVVARDRPFDEGWRARLVSATQAMLLAVHDCVIFSDADEMLVANPARFPDLRSLIAARGQPSLRAIGLDVLHRLDSEPALDPSRPVLAQRSLVRFAPLYCKTLVSRVRLRWDVGFHRLRGEAPPIGMDRDLFLFHLKAADRDIALATQALRRTLHWSEGALKSHHSVQFRLSDETMLKRYFQGAAPRRDSRILPDLDFGVLIDSGVDLRAAAPTFARIPDAFRDAIPPASPR